VNLLRSIATALALLPAAAFAATPVMTIAAAGTTGLNITLDSGFSGYTLYSPDTWGNLQPGGYVQYTLNAPVAGTYGLQVYYATASAAGANVLVNGTQQSALTMPSTGNWGTYAMSPAATVTLPAGNSVVRIAAQSTFTAFNLEGMAMTAIATGGGAPSSGSSTGSGSSSSSGSSSGSGSGSGSSSGSGSTTPPPPATGTSTINWTNVHQVIDGFGGSNAFASASMSTADQDFFFGTGTGELGLSILRVAVPDNSGITGNCASVGSSCAGAVVGDMKAALANGARVYATPWSPPANYKSNGSITCANNSAPLASGDYGAYATWLANFVQSLQAQDVNLYAISVQNEPDTCQSYDSATWTAANYDSFVKSYLGPTFAADGLSTLIMLPEAGIYSQTSGYDATCGSDPTCAAYVAGINWHDYDAVLTGTNTVQPDPYPSNFPAGKKYWETETSCPGAGSSMGCASTFTTDIGDALRWGAVVDQRLAVDGANAWLYWWLQSPESSDNQGLMNSNGTVALRAYMLGQYGKFVRPGYYRIDATHLPQTGVSVTAYQNTSTNTLVVVATNYTNAAVSQAFSLSNAPTFTSVTPTTTSASQSLAQQAAVAVSGDSFTYSLPAQSITTFVGTAQ
jgi:glucuronoarabinoxylan endo-1,4-beta-xylanase